MSPQEAEQLLWNWQFWARPNQLTPPGDWSVWLLLAGRGFGKTRTGAEWVREVACGSTPLAPGKAKRIAIVGETAADVRDVMVEGDSGILDVHPPAFRPKYEPSKRRLTWPNGVRGLLYNATEPDQLRGPQFTHAWLDELAKWQYVRETWDMLQFGMRLGDNPQQVITTTPKPIPVLKEIMKEDNTIITPGTTYENRMNLAGNFFKRIIRRYEGTRLGRQELNAELLEDVEGALWSRGQIDQLRRNSWPEARRIVVAVDPSGSGTDDRAAETGIVAAMKGVDGHGYVLEDASLTATPALWAKQAVNLAEKWDADCIVAEINFGGAMVEHTIRTAAPRARVKMLRASRGKHIRAEPVSALYEQGLVHHIGSFPYLEDQLTSFTTEGYIGDLSPDRADALVWALTDLMVGEIRLVSSREARL